MLQQKIAFTKEGYAKVEKEYLDLTQKRKAAVIALRTAREMGDLSENGAYKAARWELGGIDRQLRRLSYLLKMGRIVETKNEGIVDFGRKITISDGSKDTTFVLVDRFESDPSKNKLSVTSPIGRVIVGKRVGDEVSVVTPSGSKHYTITHIE